MSTLTSEDIKRLKTATAVCKQIGIELVVISEGMIRGFNDKMTAAIIADLPLSLDLEMGTTRVTDLDKRLGIFADLEQMTITPEFSKDNKVRNLICRGGGSKFDFRCTDTKLLERKYPKRSHATFVGELVFSRDEVALLVRGARTYGASSLTIHTSPSGVVKVQTMNDTRESFEVELKSPYDGDVSSGFSYDLTTTPLLQLIDKVDSTGEQIRIKTDQGGMLGLTLNGLNVIVTPIIHRSGSDEDE